MIDGHFTEEFLKSLPQDQVEAYGLLAQEFFAFASKFDFLTPSDESPNMVLVEDYENLMKVAALFTRVSEHFRSTKISFPSPTGKPNEDAGSLYTTLEGISEKWYKAYNIQRANSDYNNAYNAFDAIFAKESNYQFADHDYNRVQELINELRAEINGSPHLPTEHKSRLLSALEKMQRELHKKCSNVDSFYIFMGRLGESVRLLGQNLEPITKRAIEIGGFVLKAYVVTKQLENGVPGDVLDTAKDVLDTTKKLLQWP